MRGRDKEILTCYGISKFALTICCTLAALVGTQNIKVAYSDIKESGRGHYLILSCDFCWYIECIFSSLFF